MKVGEILDNRFELRELVGEGGMGHVFRARDRQTEEWVAVKTLLPQLASDPTAADELRREVRLSQKLTHPHIVAVHEYRVAERTPFIVMEFVEGKPLSYFQYEQASRRISEPCFREFADQILDAVGFAHGQGVVHRDLKPANIMVQPDGRLKLMDFGIAAGLKATYTRLTGRSSGLTIQYASPEQINGDDPSPGMDIYSLGCVFYEMLAGRPPFYQGEILHQHLTKDPAPLPEIPSELSALVLACLAKDPRLRPGSAGEVRALLAGNRTVRIPRAAAGVLSGARSMTSARRRSDTTPDSRLRAANNAAAEAASPGPADSHSHSGWRSLDASTAPFSVPAPVERGTRSPRTTAPHSTPFVLMGGAVVLGVVALAVAMNRPRPASSAPHFSPTSTSAQPQIRQATPAVSPTPLPQAPGRPTSFQRQRTLEDDTGAAVGAGDGSTAPARSASATAEETRQTVDRELAVGRAAHEVGSYAQARAAFQRALRLDPGNRAAREALARVDRAEKTEAEVGIR